MNRDQALRGVEQRIGALLTARAGPPLTGVPIPSPPMPRFALPPGETGTRMCQGVTLLVPPGVDPFALFTRDWQWAGFQPRTWAAPDGPVLVAHDRAGFVLVLLHRAGQTELYVVSPLCTRGPGGLFYAGLAVGALIGAVGPCFSMVALARAVDDEIAYLGFVPLVLLLGGALLISPGTRPFGLGLLIGGAATGLVTAGICSSMLT